MRSGATFAMVGSVLAAVGCFSPSGRMPLSVTNQDPAAAVGPATPQELAPKPAAAVCLTMAEGLEKEGKDADALVYYQRARELDPGLRDRAGHRIAVVRDRLDDQAGAMKEFADLLQRRPKDAALLNDVGYSHYNRGQWAEAEAHLRRAVAADKGNKRAWVNLGLALAQQGKTAEARDAFAKAVSPAEAQANLGFVLAAQGKLVEAAEAYRRALELEPTLVLAQHALRRIESGQLPPAPTGPAEIGATN